MSKRITFYYIKYIYLFLIGILALVCVDVFQLRVPKIIGVIVDKLQTNSLTKSNLKEFLWEMIIIIIVMAIGRFLWRIAIIGVSHFIERDLKQKMYDKAMNLPIQYYVENKSGSILSYFTSDMAVIRKWFGTGTLMIIDALFLGLYTFYKMLRLNYKLALISMIPLLLIAIFSGIIGKMMNKKFLENQQAFDELTTYTTETFRGLFVLKAFVREREELKRFKKINKNNYDKSISFNYSSICLNVITELLVWSIGAIIIGYGGYTAYRYTKFGEGNFTAGDLTVFFSYFVTITWPMFAISRLIDLSAQARASSKRIDAFFNEKEIVKDSLNTIDCPIKGDSIRFNNLTFNYPLDDKVVLKNINFEIKKGEFVGFIGKTGSGKSSIFDLILRFYNIDSDMLYIDSIDIMKLKIENVRNAIGYVDQENFLFSDKIINNVCFKGKENDEQKAIEALKMANVYDAVVKFDNGIDTVLGERGVSVSGGQKERLSIARALYTDPKILILDDSLSAVDAKTEKEIIHMIKEYRKDKITILSSNRISSIKNADKIIVLNKGEVEGIGSHDMLIKTSPTYIEINNLQSLEGGVYDEK